jgi:hypothetical protein
MESLGTLSGSGASAALAISEDGAVIAGRSGSHAARWEDGVISALPDAPGFTQGTIYGANADGSVLVGASGLAARWIDGVPESLPDMGSAVGVSDDGSVIGGLGLHGAYTHGVLWRDGTVLVLGIAPGGSYSSVTDVSADGTVAVGYDGVGPYAWTEAEGMVGLGDLPGSSGGSVPWATTGHGRIVVGSGETDLGPEAFVWSAPTGMRRLQDAIEIDLGLDLGAWTLTVASKVSPDGRFVVGWGTNPDGETEGWLLEVPDADGDGWPDLADNCLGLANPDQGDADGDGAGDACEPACGDGLDNDGDGAADLADVGCWDENGATESPACADGLNNDPGEDALIDFDGGASAGLARELQTAPDPQCTQPWKDREASKPKCGLGFELAPLLAALRLRWPRARSRRAAR